MPKYRGFINEVSLGDLRRHQYPSPISSGEIIDRFNLGAAFSGPQRTYSIPSVMTTVATAKPAAPTAPIVYPGLIDPGQLQPGIPGDIRDIAARSLPGEAIVDAPDDMTAENGVPGVDETGGFPYGDPRAAEITAAKSAPQNFVPLAIATVIAFAIFGG